MQLRALIIASASANVALIAWLGLRAAPPTAGPVAAGSAPKPPLSPAQTVTNKVEVEAPAETRAIDWHAVESADFKDYIARLRAIHCPEETIRDIIIADVNKLYASKWKSMMKPEGGIRYWDPWDGAAEYFDRNVASQRSALEKERKDLVRELLGVDLDAELRKQQMSWTDQDREDVMLSFLSEEKLTRVREIHAQAQEMSRAVFEKYRTGGMAMKPEDAKELGRIKEWERTELQKVLSPQEYAMYDLRASDLARSLRMELSLFEPSEGEFVAVARSRVTPPGSLAAQGADIETIKAMQVAQSQAAENLKQALGPERYAEYQRSRTYEYREILQFTKSQNLAKTTATQVYDIQRTTQQQYIKLMMDTSLTPEARSAAQTAIQKEAQKSVQGLLSPDAYKSYTEGSGRWLQQAASPGMRIVPSPR